MSANNYLPRRIQDAWQRMAVPESVKAMLALHGNPAYVSFWDDFVGDSAGTWPASANWGYPATVGVGTETIAIAAAVGGELTLTTNTSSGDGAGQGVGLHWNGDLNCYFAARLKIDDITSSKFEIGLTDSVADEGGAVDTKSTPTFTATDCAVFVRDTTEDVALTFVTNGGSSDGNADSAFTVANDTYFIVEIVVSGNVASGYVNGQLAGSGNIEGGNALTPWAFVETLTTAARVLTLDWWLCIGPRS
ncbi:MAG: hypothetical protein NUW01_07080 [Gemmatimonadaceae bacterium]|nr:hypothetical protein [Gemmatimonadaceae bacterium]